MLSIDASSIAAGIDRSNEIFCIPAQIIWSIAFLYFQLGYSALVGVVVILLTIPLKVIMFKYMSKLRKAQNEVMDKRVKLVSEALGNMRAVKLYAYEDWFGEKIRHLRQIELKRFLANSFAKSILSAIMNLLPTLAAIMTFIVHALIGNELDPAIIFSSLQCYNALKAPIADIPDVISALSQAMAGIARIDEFLQAEEVDQKFPIDPRSKNAIDIQGDFSLASQTNAISNGNDAHSSTIRSFQTCLPLSRRLKSGYEPLSSQQRDISQEQSNSFSIKNVDLQIPRGSLVCIVGRIGCGKTTLLSAILSEVKQVHGHVSLGGEVGYAPQSPWVRSASILDNIAFSTVLNEGDTSKLEMTIDACGLRNDIQSLPSGIFTQVGERGVTLSGGQRQRLSLAGVTYSENEIVLLDDSFSAVDPHVASHIVQNCILDGPLSGRTRVIVTHHHELLMKADVIVLMGTDEYGDGQIVGRGTYEDLLAREESFRSLLNAHQGLMNTKEDSRITKPYEAKDVDMTGSKDQVKSAIGEKLILPEDRSEGQVAYKVYQKYISAIKSKFLGFVVIVSLVLAQVASILNTLFLGYWSGNRFSGMTQNTYIGIYGGFGLALAFFTWSAIFSMTLTGIRASFYMFNSAWDGVIRSPISWHDRTPSGRVISRLSKDIEDLDDKIAGHWYNVFSSILTILGSIVFVLYIYPWGSLIFVPIIWYDYISAVFYLRISREINRLVSVLRSDIFINLGEQLSGLPIIRAVKRQEYFQRKSENSIDLHTSATMISVTVSWRLSWLAHRISFMAQLSVLTVTICGIVFRKTIGPAEFGVVLSYVMISTSISNRLVGYFVEAVVSMNTVERVQHYMELPREAPTELSTDPPSEVWPTKGGIVFKDVSMRYRPDLPLALENINFAIKPGERFGIIGRTGSGKSSLTQVLFRLVEISDDLSPYRDEVDENVIRNRGVVEIDGLDISKLGLRTLRDSMSIIPQDPFLFSGTIRENIDPSGSFTDDELNENIQLISGNSRTSDSLREKLKLDYIVIEKGSNLSSGERQLVALIRAMIKKSKILILDEATSSVDPQTDTVIQEIIQDHFKDITLISIAHRIQTVINHDKILVMDQGKLVELGPPKELYDTPYSIFRKVCEQSFTPDHAETIKSGQKL
uniref:P-loop containing nucleoside triphosphate hydrolase protein n=1 Tax=Kwoniella pini CBS 10737 TaxID=1296096 RepID=A0A1B9HXM2_9TREE|nr:uncharacterized protein I206_05884 [Kwoniella pini CBS 10737]OCF48017.1 hypothetical protein I206_05884 [Kwoniella pini CBS 10737]